MTESLRENLLRSGTGKGGARQLASELQLPDSRLATVVAAPPLADSIGPCLVELAGVTKAFGATLANAEIDPRVRNAALGFVGAMQDLPFYTTGGSELLVFKLGGSGAPSGAPPSNPNPQGTGNAPTH